MSDDATRGGPEHRLERLIFFSDAVFAIAITLLVIEIKVPEVPHGADDVAFINALLRLTPQFIGFLISFYVIGAFWSGHHRAFALAANWSPRLMLANLNMLMTIAAMPFFTAFVSDYGNTRVPVVAYCAWLVLTAEFNRRIQAIATRAPVLAKGCEAEAVLVRRRGTATLLGALTATIVAALAPLPSLGQAALMTIPLWRLALGRIEKTA